jgi:cysteine synthase A
LERPSVIELKKINNTGSQIFAKLDFMNPTGSIKDVMAYYMVKRAEESGKLKPGSEILEVTTGNTGISLAFISSLRGYRFTVVMPEHMSRERRQIMESYGANVILTPKEEDMPGAIRKFRELAGRMPDAWLPMQFKNPDNVAAHREITGKEILQGMNGGKIDAVVAGVGTGGTLMGVAQAVRKVNRDVRIVAVEPSESAVMSEGKPGIHGIQGIGEGFIPELVETGMIDEVVAVKTWEAIEMMRKLYEKEGLFTGISSGANVLASLRIAEKLGRGRNVVTLLPDTGSRYLSMGIFNSVHKK